LQNALPLELLREQIFGWNFSMIIFKVSSTLLPFFFEFQLLIFKIQDQSNIYRRLKGIIKNLRKNNIGNIFTLENGTGCLGVVYINCQAENGHIFDPVFIIPLVFYIKF
jgi:hypothetical protein